MLFFPPLKQIKIRFFRSNPAAQPQKESRVNLDVSPPPHLNLAKRHGSKDTSYPTYPIRIIHVVSSLFALPFFTLTWDLSISNPSSVRIFSSIASSAFPLHTIADPPQYRLRSLPRFPPPLYYYFFIFNNILISKLKTKHFIFFSHCSIFFSLTLQFYISSSIVFSEVHLILLALISLFF